LSHNRNNKWKFYNSILVFILISLIGLVINIIYFEYLKIIFPNDTTFLGLPFNIPTFIFGFTLILIISFSAILVYYFPKSKKKMNSIKKKKDII